MQNKFSRYTEKLKKNALFKDSFWAVFGNGLGNGLLLVSGIIIANILGKDLYGEYGLVKTTLFYVASFATFGIGLTSTKYIASFIASNSTDIKIVSYECLKLTLLFSTLMASLLFVFSKLIAIYIDAPQLYTPLRFLAVIIIIKAISTTQSGILAGLKQFKVNAQNNILSGFIFVIICIPLTKYFSIYGALSGLLISQISVCLVNGIRLRGLLSTYPCSRNSNYSKEIIKFSFPVALQESSIWICNWLAVIILTKYSSTGEMGLYTAAAQWNSIILFVPSLLSNVVLSYISGSKDSGYSHSQIFKIALGVNFVFTFIPFIIVFIFSDYIAYLYGESFYGIQHVLRIITFATIFECCSYVFKSEFINIGKVWNYFLIRIIRDVAMLVSAYFLIVHYNGSNGSIYLSISFAFASGLFLLLLILSLRRFHKF